MRRSGLPCFWPRAPNTLGISSVFGVIKVSFVMLMNDFGMPLGNLRVPAGCQGRPNPVIRGLKLSVLSSPARGEGLEVTCANDQRFNQSHLVMKPCENWKGWFWRLRHGRGRQRGHGGPGPLPSLCPVHLFHLAVPELYPFIVNWGSSK